MSYDTLATRITPALVIYLLDLSGSMSTAMEGRRRIDIVADALKAAIQQMIFRSTKGSVISPRYHIALYVYSQDVFDVFDGIKPIDKVARLGLPDLSTMNSTNTDKGFEQVEKLLQARLGDYQGCPAPLVCHMTDGEYTGKDPQPIAERIMRMAVPDGNVLVENIFISDKILPRPVDDAMQWPGILPDTELWTEYGLKLRAMSSLLPPSYRVTMLEMGYQIAPGALMLLPGAKSELVKMGFQMSTTTPVM
jgi:uncharacterized protein YegL